MFFTGPELAPHLRQAVGLHHLPTVDQIQGTVGTRRGYGRFGLRRTRLWRQKFHFFAPQVPEHLREASEVVSRIQQSTYSTILEPAEFEVKDAVVAEMRFYGLPFASTEHA